MPSPTKPHFVVDASFYSSKEVMSIPRRYRAQAIGLWTLCGSWSADKQTDGWVPAEVIVENGGTPLIAELLVIATLWDSAEPGADPLPKRSRGRAATDGDGRGSAGHRSGIGRASVGHRSGIVFRNWSKWQKTKKEWDAGRDANARRQAEHRKRRSGNSGDEVSRVRNALQAAGFNTDSKHDDDDRNALRVTQERKGTELSKKLSTVGSVPGPAAQKFPDHCNAHRTDPQPPPCPDCRRVRMQNGAEASHADAIAAADRTAATKRRAACPVCHGEGLVSDDPADPWAAMRRCPECRT